MRAAGMPSAPQVASVMALGSRMSAASAWANHWANCSMGSADASASVSPVLSYSRRISPMDIKNLQPHCMSRRRARCRTVANGVMR